MLKLSGEALAGTVHGFDAETFQRIAGEIKQVVETGIQIAMVIGGGNVFRGKGLVEAGLDRATGDHIGMLATVINSLAMQDVLEKHGVETRMMSAIRINQICEEYIRRRAIRHLEKRRVVILAAGTGNPFLTTDTAASLRAAEIGADLMLKATKVKGIYNTDPKTNQDATFYRELSYDQVLGERLGVMDAAAVVMCRENEIPLRVFNVLEHNALPKIASGESIGTLVS